MSNSWFRVMDAAYMQDGKIQHTGEALMLACLIYSKKKRTPKLEEELKDVIVFNERG